jgi:dUTP pyrophosphatase
MLPSSLTPTLPIRRLHPEARIPSYQSEGAAGLDLSACLPGGPVTLQPGEIRAIPTGLAMAIPQGYEGQVRPRSGLSTKHGMTCPNSPGTIDSDYRGELLVPMINLGREAFTVTHGLRIAQLVIAPVAHARLIEVQSLDDTARGEGGFGSTGLA